MGKTGVLSDLFQIKEKVQKEFRQIFCGSIGFSPSLQQQNIS